MRLVQVVVPDEQRERILSALRERELGYSTTRETSGEGDRTLVSFVVPADAVEHILQDLDEAGLEEDWYIVSLETEFASFDGIDEVQDKWAKTPNRVAPRTLRSKAKDMRLNTRSYLWMMTLSTIIATAGIMLDSPAVVVGSMVLAPIVSPMLTAMVGAVRDDRAMLVDSLRMQGVGLGVAVVGAVLFSLVLKSSFVVPTTLEVGQMPLVSNRFAPSVLAVTVGLAAGAAGAFSLATKGQVTIVGVMIAAALIPTAAAAGIGFAWGVPVVGLGALVLLLVTIIAVNLGGYLMLSYLDYEPDGVDTGFFEFGGRREIAVVAGTVALVLVVVVAVGFGAYQQFVFEQSVNRATTDVLERDRYEQLDVISITTEYVGVGPLLDPSTVTVTLSRLSDRSYDGLPNELARAISDRADENLTVRVRYQDYERSNVTTRSVPPADLSSRARPSTTGPSSRPATVSSFHATVAVSNSD